MKMLTRIISWPFWIPTHSILVEVTDGNEDDGDDYNDDCVFQFLKVLKSYPAYTQNT